MRLHNVRTCAIVGFISNRALLYIGILIGVAEAAVVACMNCIALRFTSRIDHSI